MENKISHVCPWWLGYLFLIPWRKYQHNPDKILGPHVKKDMTVLDFGSAMGYFSIPLAQMTGLKGKVYCVDIQEKMLSKLQKRAVNFNVENIIVPLLVGKNYEPLKLQNTIDFALIFAVVHEVPNKTHLFNDLFLMLNPGGKVLFAEPKGHVKQSDFEKSLEIAKNAGFQIMNEKPMKKGLCAFLIKP
jgi:ubiquinone/menaquinone biosynthesis C-methylase UbiE